MFIVKRGSEIVRFGIFVLMAGLMVYFIYSRSELFQSSAAKPSEPKAPAKVTVTQPAKPPIQPQAPRRVRPRPHPPRTRPDRPLRAPASVRGWVVR